MVTAEEFQTSHQFTAQNSSYLDCMALPELEKKYCLPCFPPSRRAPNDVAFPGQSVYLPGLNTGQHGAVGGSLELVPPYCNKSYPTGNPYLKDSRWALSGPGVTAKPVGGSCAPQKRFLIFDQSGNHTRMFFSPSFSPQGQLLATKISASADGPCRNVAARIDQQFSMKPIVVEKWDENHLTDEEDEGLEDTEDINALLYSDSDDHDDEYDDNYSGDGENDEVTSTGHCPFSAEEDCNKDKLLNGLTEQVASSDDSPKRQRMLDGKYKKSSLESAESPLRRAISSSYKDDVESCCAGHDNSYGDIDSVKRENKLKIRQALKILGTIIPGLDSRDPLSIIDKAVAYLKSMKTEAEALGFSYPECNSAISP